LIVEAVQHPRRSVQQQDGRHRRLAIAQHGRRLSPGNGQRGLSQANGQGQAKQRQHHQRQHATPLYGRERRQHQDQSQQ